MVAAGASPLPIGSVVASSGDFPHQDTGCGTASNVHNGETEEGGGKFRSMPEWREEVGERKSPRVCAFVQWSLVSEGQLVVTGRRTVTCDAYLTSLKPTFRHIFSPTSYGINYKRFVGLQNLYMSYVETE